MATTTATSGTSATASLASSLGVGTGVDTKALVASLVQAQFAAKTAQLTSKSETLTAQISGVAKLKSAVSGFDSALKSLVKGGTLATAPQSSNSSVLTATTKTGGAVSPKLSASITVETLAQAQAATTNTPVAATQGFKGGKLTVAIGAYDASGTLSPSRTVDITVADGATLADIAKQITKDTGLQTQLVNDGTGQRLTIKGASGADQAFEIAVDQTGTDGAQADLTTLGVGGGSGGATVGTTAKNAVVVMDGARFSRPSNTIDDLIDGVKLNLVSTSSTPVTLGASAPTSAISQGLSDFVETFNQLLSMVRDETNINTGTLKNDSSATAIVRSLSTLTTTKLATSTTNGPQTLADIGVSTNRDGSLSVDTARLNRAMLADPAGVEALFADGIGASGGGLAAAFSAIATRLTNKTGGLDAAATRYTKQQTELSTAQSKISDLSTAASDRLTKQYAAMDARVAAYKATQAFMTNQIAAWNKSS
jgi:flagellar hook-associated protein 2